ncbi:MAG: ATP-binding protein [Ignavibacteria bacterium]|nr:ATP-binding protein [Ignavibacteria bacterium]
MIKDIILSQQNTLKNTLSKKYIKRDVELGLNKNNSLIKVIIGPRRAGKSYFAIHKLRETENFGYVNFDDERIRNLKNNDEINEAVNSVYGNPEYLLLDEIQNLSKWELFVNRLQREGYKLVLTGSNSNLLSSELATHLTGRYLPYFIFPFSFKEYLRVFSSKKKISNKNHLNNYIESGGFPEILLFDIDLKNYIETLLQSILLKDIVIRYKIRLADEIQKLANYVIINTGSEFSYSKISRYLKIRSDKTVEKFIKYFENVFLLFQVSRFSYKYKNQITYNKKLYTYDNAFLQGNEYFYGFNKGKLLENLVAVHLKQKEFINNEKLFYYRTKNNYEVDFLVEKNGKILKLIQVCYDLSNIKTFEREIRSLLIAGRELNCKELVIINPDEEMLKEYSYSGTKQTIKLVSAQNILLK